MEVISHFQEFQGDFNDSYAARAGFILKLGKEKNNSQMSLEQNRKLIKEIEKLKADNIKLKASNKSIHSIYKKLLLKFEELEKHTLKRIQSFSSKLSLSE